MAQVSIPHPRSAALDQDRGAVLQDLETESDLIAVAIELAGRRKDFSQEELQLCPGIQPYKDKRAVDSIRAQIRQGSDPLGEAFARIRPAKVRRNLGAIYTPPSVVSYMLSWAAEFGEPDRVVDPGAGSGRFLLAASELFPRARLVAVEFDPVASILLRANIAVLGLGRRAAVLVEDYRKADLPEIPGRTLFIGNPPYVRHHQIDGEWKTWFARAAGAYGIKASKLAGLHIHFFVRTLQLARSGDLGAFITSAEWLDVNYGATVRQLLADGLGGVAVHLLDARSMPFENAATTGAITCFRVGDRPKSLFIRMVDKVEQLKSRPSGKFVPWEEAEKCHRWSGLLGPRVKVSPGSVELGEICRVHRGQVTGCNSVWIEGPEASDLPDSVLIPAVTKAREILKAGSAIEDIDGLRRIVDLPEDLDSLDEASRSAVDRFLRWARRQGAHKTYIARHRRKWWSVGLREPAPIICTYMARRPPVFVRNPRKARHINIAHGLYPIEPLPDRVLDALAVWLSGNVGVEGGRTYAGGLVKYEPRELERVLVPAPERLSQ